MPIRFNSSIKSKTFKHFFRPSIEFLEDRTVPANFDVTTTDDITDPNDGLLSLREAISQAQANSLNNTIFVRPNTTYRLTQGELLINTPNGLSIRADTVIGNGTATIDANHASRVLTNQSGSKVQIVEINLINGSTTSAGGGVVNHGELELAGLSLNNNTTSGPNANGGGVYNTGTLILARANIHDNSTTGDNSFGGGVYNSTTGTVKGTFFISTLEGNKTFGSGASGGGIYNAGIVESTAYLNVKGNSTEGSSAEGGGIYNAATGDYTIGSSVENNWTKGSTALGGGISNYGTMQIVIGGIFTGQSIKGNHTEGTFALGGGIYNSGTMILDLTTIENNYTKGFGSSGGGLFNSHSGNVTLPFKILNNHTEGYLASGGGVYSVGNLNYTLAQFLVDFIEISNNETHGNKSYGGGLYFAGNQSFKMAFAKIYNNSTHGNDSEGGGIFNAGPLILDAKTVIDANNTYGDNSSGGGIYNAVQGTLTITGLGGNGILGGQVAISNNKLNSSKSNGAGIYNLGVLTVDDTRIVSNEVSGGYGGGVFIGESSKSVTFGVPGHDTNTVGFNKGDGITIAGSGAQITNSLIFGNSKAGVSLIGGQANNNTIGSTSAGIENRILNNSMQGISVIGNSNIGFPQGNQFLRNVLLNNGLLGIDLGGDGITLNDPLDPDQGPNLLQNFPLINSVLGSQVVGIVNSVPSTLLRLEFFLNTNRDPSGFGEGETFLGFVDVTTDSNGSANFTFDAGRNLEGLFVSSTATSTNGGTSEFSQTVRGLAVPPVSNPPVQPVPNPNPSVPPPSHVIITPTPLPGTSTSVPVLLPPSVIRPGNGPILPPNPVKNTPIVAPGVTPLVTAGGIAPTAGVASIMQPKAGLVVGAGLNGHSIVGVYNPDGSVRAQFVAFPGFFGGVRLGTADVNNDGHPDILAAAGIGGSPHVKVFDGATGSEIRSFFAYDVSFIGGVFITGGDLNGDGFAEIITGAGSSGGPHVKVFDGFSGIELSSFYAYDPNFHGGVTVACGDLNNDGLVEIVTGAGAGGGPHVKVIEGTSLRMLLANGQISDLALLASYYAYSPSFVGGVFVASGIDLNSDGLSDVITGAGSGGGPHVKVVNTNYFNQIDPSGQISDAALLASFYGFEDSFQGGVRVGKADASQDGLNELIIGAGTGGGPRVKVIQANQLHQITDFFAFTQDYAGGIFVD